jgi:hypothetical protein
VRDDFEGEIGCSFIVAEGELGKFLPESLKAKMPEKQAEPKTGT